MTGPRVPVVFVHGLWLHSTSWQPWAERFREAGYEPILPEWPGVPDTVAEAREHPESQAGIGIDEVIEHHARIVAALPASPVLIGHSFGGLVVQALLDRGLGRAGVAIDPAPIRGVVRLPPAQIRSTLPVLGNPANRKRAVSLTPEQFRASFGNALPAEESEQLHERWTIPAPGRPLFQAALANMTPRTRAATAVDTRRDERSPLLIISGGADRTVPDSVSRAAYKLYGKSAAVTEFRQFPDRGHSLTVDSGWPEVAEVVLEWLRKQGIGGQTPPA
jgi:pimeloyl-ACP methyl ester carboxylesterase